LSSNLEAFSASHGTLLWTYSEADQRIEPFAPVIAGGVVYVGLNEQVVAISAATGAILWHSPTLTSQQLGVFGLSVVTGG
jgi:outer membrane protein assembly factor BamB